jgi:hypothetical protein
MPAEVAKRYERKLVRGFGDPPRQRDDTVLFRSLERFASQIREEGARCFYVIAPTLGSNGLSAISTTAKLSAPTLAFDDPAKYPELYSARHRYDEQHLNAKGAELFSAFLADRVAALLTAGE